MYFRDPNILSPGEFTPDVVLYNICMTPNQFYIVFGAVITLCIVGGFIIGAFCMRRYALHKLELGEDF